MIAAATLHSSIADCPVAADGALGGSPPPSLHDRLAGLAAQAAQFADEISEIRADRSVGYVESIRTDESGWTWVAGWMVDDGVTERPIIVDHSSTHAAGFAYVLAPRADLPANGKAFAGVITPPWQGTSGELPSIVFADDTGRFLEPLQTADAPSVDGALPIVRDVLSRADCGNRNDLRNAFNAIQHWTVDPASNSVDLVQVDDVVILAGFGAIVSGWALSPTRVAAHMSMKTGSIVIQSDPRSQFLRSRPDLASVHTDLVDVLGRAGFVCVFRGSFDMIADEMVLKVIWNDGTSTNARVPDTVRRSLGVTTPLDTVRRFYSSIEHEHFFADFAQHAARVGRQQARQVQPYHVEPAEAAVILAMPEQTSDLFLILDGAVRSAALLPPAWGIAVLVPGTRTRTAILSMFMELCRACNRPYSLFFTHDGSPTSDAIASVAEQIGASRVAWVGANALLTQLGWRSVGAATAPLTLLEVCDANAETAPTEMTSGDEAFVVDIAEWRRLSGSAPARIGGVALPAEDLIRSPILAGACLSLGSRRGSTLIEHINQACLP